MAERDGLLFSRVLSAFKSRLSSKDIQNFQFTTFDDLKSAINDIQRAQAQRRGFRNLNKIRPFLNGLEQYSKVIEVFVNAKPDIMAFVWGPIKFCLQIASKLTEAFDALLDTYERIGSTLSIFSVVERLFLSHGYVQQVLVDVYEDILDFHKRAVLFFKQSAWRLVFKVTIHTFGDMFGDVIKKLERSKELLLQSSSLAHFQEAQESRLLFSKEFEAQLERTKKDRKLTVIDWLSPISCLGDHEELHRKRDEFPLTTRWIFQEPSLQCWIRPDKTTKQMFWVHGIPGAGKTVLFSSVIDFVKDTIPDSQVIYFYCKNGDPSKRTFDGVARSLIAQILQLNPVSLDFLHETAVKSGERHPSTFSMYRDILRPLLTSHNLLYLGIDGLDECEKEDRRWILMLLEEISKFEGNIKLFITSQRIKDIEKSLETSLRFEIKSRHLRSDIQNYVNIRSVELCDRYGLGDEKRYSIIKDICSRSEGMFLLARLIMDNLADQDNLEDLEEELSNDKLPRGIDEAYGRILARLSKGPSERSQKRIVRILELLITARHPLKVHEVQGALSIDVEDMSVDFEKRRLRGTFTELCGPIVELHADDTLTMVHPTAKQYLVQHNSRPYIDIIGAKLRMATLCVKYLAFECFSDLHKPDNYEIVAAGAYAFQQYATLNWIYHSETLFNLDAVDDSKGLGVLENFCLLLLSRHIEMPITLSETLSLGVARQGNQDLQLALSRLKAVYEAVYSIVPDRNSDVLYSIPYCLGNLSQVRSVLEKLAASATKLPTMFQEAYGVKIFNCSILSCSRFLNGFKTQKLRDMHETTHQGQRLDCTHEGCDYSIIGFSSTQELAKHMIEHEMPPREVQFPKVKSCSLRKSLEYAIDKDDGLAVKALLSEASTSLFKEADFLGRALSKKSCGATKVLLQDHRLEESESSMKFAAAKVIKLAAENDDVEMASLAIKMVPHVLPESELKCNPLAIAASRGHAGMVTLLLNQGDQNLEVEWVRDHNPLKAAARNGHEEVLSILISKYGASITQKKNLYALMTLAASMGYESTVKLLLKEGRKLDAEKYYPRHLQILAPDIERMLAQLMRGFNTKNRRKISDLMIHAAIEGNCEEVSRLLESGADTSYFSHELGIILGIAASQGDLSIVQELLDRGAVDMNDGTALVKAAVGGHLPVVKLLLETNMSFESKHGDLLCQAVENGHEAVVDLLLDFGVNVNLESTPLGLTALQVAVEKGSQAMVQRLLEKGANQDTGSLTITPLERAVKKGDEAVVKLLLEGNADPNIINDKGLLFRAAAKGQKSIVSLLLNFNVIPTSSLLETLQRAVREDHEAVVKLLLKENVNLDIIHYPYLLHTAAAMGYERIVSSLLDFGFDINWISVQHRSTALQVAVDNGHEAVVKLLLERNTNPHVIINDEGLLYRAAPKGHESVVSLLLDFGADVNLKPINSTKLAIDLAVENGHEAVVKLLLKKNSGFSFETITIARMNGNEAIFIMLTGKDTLQDAEAYWTFKKSREYQNLFDNMYRDAYDDANPMANRSLRPDD